MSEEMRLSLYDIETGLAEAVNAAMENPDDDGASALVRLWLEGAIEKRDRVAAFRQHLIAQQAFADTEIQRLRDRKASIVKAQERLDGIVVAAMEASGQRKLEGKTATFALRKKPDRVEIRNQEALPPEFLRLTPAPPPEPDKAAIKKAIQAGQEVPGASLVFGENALEVR